MIAIASTIEEEISYDLLVLLPQAMLLALQPYVTHMPPASCCWVF
jgi:hypothetical protein